MNSRTFVLLLSFLLLLIISVASAAPLQSLDINLGNNELVPNFDSTTYDYTAIADVATEQISFSFAPEVDSLMSIVQRTEGGLEIQPMMGVFVLAGQNVDVPFVLFPGASTFLITVSDVAQEDDSSYYTIVVERPLLLEDYELTVDEDARVELQLPVPPEGVTYALVNQPTNGQVEIINAVFVNYFPNSNYAGNDQFTYTIESSGDADPGFGTVDIVVNPVNDAPFVDQEPLSFNVVQGELLQDQLRGSDVDSELLFYTVSVAPQNGVVDLLNPNNGEFSYSPVEGFQGDDEFFYFVTDEEGLFSELRRVVITVTPGPVVDLVPFGRQFYFDSNSGSLTLGVRNDGLTQSPAFSVEVTLPGEEETFTTLIEPIDSGAMEVERDIFIPGEMFQEGAVVRLVVDPENEVVETNENNNVFEMTLSTANTYTFSSLGENLEANFNPPFSSLRRSYTLNAIPDEDTVTFTSEVTSPEITSLIYFNNDRELGSVSPGESITIDLEFGNNDLRINLYVEEDLAGYYLINIQRPRSPALAGLDENLAADSVFTPDPFDNSRMFVNLPALFTESTVMFTPRIADPDVAFFFAQGDGMVQGGQLFPGDSFTSNLAVGGNWVDITFYNEDWEIISQYFITIPREGVLLSSIQENLSADVAPVFDPLVREYLLNASYEEGSVTFTSIFTDPSITSLEVTNGFQSSFVESDDSVTFPLTIGGNAITFNAIARNDEGEEFFAGSYTVFVERAGAPLLGLQENLAADFIPAFDPAIREYSLQALYTEREVNITPLVAEDSSVAYFTVWMNDEPQEIVPGESFTFPLRVSFFEGMGNNIISLDMFDAQDQYLGNYVVVVDRVGAEISSLTENLAADLAPSFESAVKEYTLVALPTEETIELTFDSENEDVMSYYVIRSSMFADGADEFNTGEGERLTLSLDTGMNMIMILPLDAEGNFLNFYRLTVNRLGQGRFDTLVENASGQLSPTFDPAIPFYMLPVLRTEQDVQFTFTANDSTVGYANAFILFPFGGSMPVRDQIRSGESFTVSLGKESENTTLGIALFSPNREFLGMYQVMITPTDQVIVDPPQQADPVSPGLSSSGSGVGRGPAGVKTACSDGQDNDGDGLRDLADPGCSSANDGSENGGSAPAGESSTSGSSTESLVTNTVTENQPVAGSDSGTSNDAPVAGGNANPPGVGQAAGLFNRVKSNPVTTGVTAVGILGLLSLAAWKGKALALLFRR